MGSGGRRKEKKCEPPETMDRKALSVLPALCQEVVLAWNGVRHGVLEASTPMRLSRSCYDKWHRCPGWAGGGWHYPKGPNRCEDGYIQIDWDARFVRWRFWKCNKCDVVIWPWHTRWLDPTWLIWWVPNQIKDFWEDPKWYIRQRWLLSTYRIRKRRSK